MKNESLKKIEKYIDFILSSDLKGNEILKREYPGIVEHDNKDQAIAQEIYDDLKEMCKNYRDGQVDSETLSEFCGNVMYSKYSPRVVQKIVSDEIYDALDYISELDFNSKKEEIG